MSNPSFQAQVDAARAYESLFVPALFEQWSATIADAVNAREGQQVLDVGCGTGALTREIAARVGTVGRVVGLDPGAGMLAVAREVEPSIEWQEGVAESLPFADESFDAVVSQFALMFFADKRAAVREIVRVLKRSGRFAIAVWDSLDNIPAFAAEVALLERIAGHEAADALRAPFQLGDRKALQTLFSGVHVAAEISAHQGTAKFSTIRTMVEADLRGWLPLMNIILAEDLIQEILREADDSLGAFTSDDGRAEFAVSALLVTGTKH